MKVELICYLYNKKMVDDLGIEQPDIEALITIDTDSIEAIRQRGSDEENDICDKTCMVIMKSGDSFQVGKTYKEMLGIWRKYNFDAEE